VRRIPSVVSSEKENRQNLFEITCKNESFECENVPISVFCFFAFWEEIVMISNFVSF
jgi:hypothetical protein